MKKIVKKLAIICLVTLLLAVTLVGCGKKSVDGYYIFENYALEIHGDKASRGLYGAFTVIMADAAHVVECGYVKVASANDVPDKLARLARGRRYRHTLEFRSIVGLIIGNCELKLLRLQKANRVG